MSLNDDDNTEPERQTPIHLLGIQEELAKREPVFHCPENGLSRAALENMTAPEFWETGASGRRYARGYVLDVVERRFSGPPAQEHWQCEDFYCQEIAPDHYLLTYTLQEATRVTRRASFWRRTNTGWVIVYYQGTVVAKAGP